MAFAEALTLAPAPFDAAAREALASTFTDYSADVVADAIRLGGAVHYRCTNGAHVIASLYGDVLLIWCLAGSDMQSLARMLIALAKWRGCIAVAFMTERPALARLLRSVHPFPVRCNGRTFTFGVRIK